MTLAFGISLTLGSVAACRASDTAPGRYFSIRIVDDQTGRGVPLAGLITVNHIVHVSDSNGLIAFAEPDLMDREVFFFVQSHGYEFPQDGFGYAGVRLQVKAGAHAEVRLKRLNIAERLYRVTGQGIYGDSVLLGVKPPLAEPLLNAQVMGQDSVQAVPYRGRIYWFWGDTNRASYPLGHFQTSGATSEWPGRGGLDPSLGVDLTYFRDADGFSKRMVPFPEEGMIWIDGLLTLSEEGGRERLVAHYARMKSLGEMLEHGLIVFDDEREEFERLARFDVGEPWRCPRGHPVRVREGDAEFFYFPMPFATVRVKATWSDLINPASYEDLGHDRDAVVTDAESGHAVKIHGGSISWNPYRRKWILIGVEIGGTSFLGEIWYAEADHVTGPWHWARKIVTHDHYSFYNAAQHPFFDQEGGCVIYFEGTYATTFSNSPSPTPRYDYNQIMYRLDLADPRLRFPASLP